MCFVQFVFMCGSATGNGRVSFMQDFFLVMWEICSGAHSTQKQFNEQ